MAKAPVRILIVDDEAPHMRALCDTLQDHQFYTAGFTSGEAGLAALREARYDLLLADLMMPGMDGITLLHEAQKIDPHLCCIIMTGEGTVSTAVRAMKAGAFDYILKPFKLSVILPVLTRAVETRRLRVRNERLEKAVRRRSEELARANEELQQSSRHKSEFLANMSHELRTPLNSIIGFTEFIIDGKSGPLGEKQKSQLEMVHASGKHLLNLINDLLDVSKIEAGKAEVFKEWIPLVSVVEEVMRTIAPMAAGKGITLEFALDLPDSVHTDRRMFFQVLLNLVNNAVKFTDRGGVKVSGGMHRGRVRIEVADSGIGIKPESVAKLFEAFRQVDGSSTRRHEGTGLGLYLCKRILALLDGDISVQSEYGSGSRFMISIPIGRS
ncbi:MAG TPA: hybrid sensor histidine kinase/response regulator [Chthoniobacteraceae bacterium]|jgi:signal transduction histidine kinase|nr:hybrid sensor histidine kinase/response regulator [Chthoniobacteraceae bacterium]